MRSCREDHVRAAELLQALCGSDLLRVDVLVRAELTCELFFVRPARHGDRAEAHTRRILDREVTEPADPLNRDGVSRTRAAVAKRVERRDTCAEERPGIDRIDLLRNAHH